MRAAGCCTAWLALVACGRLGFEPVDRAPIGDAPSGDVAISDAPLFCTWTQACAGSFTCCEPGGARCVQTPQECQGPVALCDVHPPYDGCNLGEACCVIAPQPYPRCFGGISLPC